MRRQGGQGKRGHLTTSCGASLLALSCRKNAPQRIWQNRRIRRASSHPSRTPRRCRSTIGWMTNPRRRNCYATTFRRSRHILRMKTGEGRIRWRLAAAPARPCRRLSVRNSLPASSQRRRRRPRVSPSRGVPRGGSASPGATQKAEWPPAGACRTGLRADFALSVDHRGGVERAGGE